MLFNSIEFLIFFPLITLIYFLLPSKIRWIWLLVGSVYFYMCWKAKYILLIGFSIAVTWIGSMVMVKLREKSGDKTEKICKATLYGVITANLAVLFLFKYYNFFAENVCRFTHISMPILRFALPVGISFYTFQALGYSIDVYRGTIEAEKNPFRYALFVCFFPQLVAGPIERAGNLLPQLQKPTKFDIDNLEQGLLQIGWGLFMKLVIADRISIFVDNIYDNLVGVNGAFVLLATILFAFQIYCDFASYSIIARGSAQVLGFKLMKNFNFPYSSKTIAEFWERWHISLSKWFEDYIYNPFVWNSKDRQRAVYSGFILVFIVSGFWHGASWTYVLWGIIHAAYRLVGALTKKKRRKMYKKYKVNVNGTFFNVYRTIATFLLVDFTYIFFRANSISDALYVVKSIVTSCNIGIIFTDTLYSFGISATDFNIIFIGLIILWLVDYLTQKIDVKEKILSLKLPLRWFICLSLIVAIVLFGVYGPRYDATPFIYFQF